MQAMVLRACGAPENPGVPRTIGAQSDNAHARFVSVRAHSLQRLPDAVLDVVATTETLTASLRSLAPAGRRVIMGYVPRGGVLETPTWRFTEEIEVTGNRSAGRDDVAQSIALVQNGRIRPVVDKVYALKDAVAAHEAFEAGEITGRAVLVP